MGGLFGARPTIALAGLEAGLVTFKCNRRLKAGVNVTAEAVLPREHRYLVQVRVLEVLPGGLYAGRLGPPDMAELVADDFARATSQTHYKVADEPTHHIRKYLVRGKALPHYRATTCDLSTAKARLHTDSAMTLGASFEGVLELDEHRKVPMNCQVISCGRELSGGFTVGVRWFPCDPRHEGMLTEFLASLKR